MQISENRVQCAPLYVQLAQAHGQLQDEVIAQTMHRPQDTTMQTKADRP